jgi:hypothetical protein
VYLLVVSLVFLVGLIATHSSVVIPKGPPDPARVCLFGDKLYSEGYVRHDGADYLRCHNTQWVTLESTSHE